VAAQPDQELGALEQNDRDRRINGTNTLNQRLLGLQPVFCVAEFIEHPQDLAMQRGKVEHLRQMALGFAVAPAGARGFGEFDGGIKQRMVRGIGDASCCQAAASRATQARIAGAQGGPSPQLGLFVGRRVAGCDVLIGWIMQGSAVSAMG
jgi:hypothetical protein